MSIIDIPSGLSTLRNVANDRADSKFVYREKPSGLQDGVNKLFRFLDRNLVVPTWKIHLDAAEKSNPADWQVVDAATGQFQFTTAPPVTVAITGSYFYQDLSDAALVTYLILAAQREGFDTAFGIDIPSGLQPAIVYFAAADAYYALAREFAERFDWSVESKTVSMQAIADKYNALAKDFESRGIVARDDFYKRQGRREAPASAASGFILRPYTPRR